jgi:transcriptional regulator with PAS, ATPase and Fis domain
MTRELRSRSGATTHESGPPSSFRIGERVSVSFVVVHSADESAVDRVIALDAGPVVVGRDVEGAGVCLNDGHLSRVHFRVSFDGRAGHHRVTDAGSRNGTIVSGARVDSAVIRPGDVIRAGDSVFVYGEPDPLGAVRQRIQRVAKTPLAVLLLGETGTGKERLARAVHDLSLRSGPFIAVNCASLPRELLGAELFGHTRGAFSGAVQSRLGLFQTAHQGTLFLDEIGDFPLDLQAVLLRALQEGTVRPVGSDQEIAVDVRVVGATNSRIEDAVRTERFRADLYARLAQAVVRVPPLRERRVEVLSLCRDIARTTRGAEVTITADAAEVLVRHTWPFNVRELESLIRAFVATEGERPLGLGYLKEFHSGLVLGFRDRDTSPPQPLQTTVEKPSHDRAELEQLLARHLGNVSAVAKELGKQRAQVYRWLKAEGLDPSRYRD